MHLETTEVGLPRPRVALLAALVVCLAGTLLAQEPKEGSAGPLPPFTVESPSESQSAAGEAAEEPAPTRPVPVVSGFGAFIPTWEGGQATLVTIVSPVLLVPIGQHWLIESRASFEGDFTRPPGGGPFAGPVNKSVDYLQLDYVANRYLTFTAGRFLTPFGMFNERLYPNWIRNLQTDPLILPLSTEANDGFMVRGGVPVSPEANFNYAVYFSTLSTVNKFESDRLVGARLGLFLPGPRLEIGASIQHLLQEDHGNVFGLHLEWQPRALPLDIRSEYAYSGNGKGYWLEGAYRLTQVPFWRRPMSHSQVVFRVQHFFLGKNGPGAGEGLPDSETARVEFGVNYFLRDGLKVVASYGRTFSSVDGNSNIWTAGVTYRFAFPLGKSR